MDTHGNPKRIYKQKNYIYLEFSPNIKPTLGGERRLHFTCIGLKNEIIGAV